MDGRKKITSFLFFLTALIVSVAGCSTVSSKKTGAPGAGGAFPPPAWIHMFDERNGYGSGWSGNHAVVLVTSNGGATWTNVTPSTPANLPPWAGRTGYFINPQTGWVFELRPEKSVTVYGTRNGGQSWSQLAVVPVRFGDGGMFIAFSGSRQGWFEDISAGNGQLEGELFATRDGGELWQRVATSGHRGSLPFGGGLTAQKDGTLWLSGGQRAGGSLGGPGFVWLYQSTDGGKTWFQVDLPLAAVHKEETTAVSAPVFFGNNGFVTVRFQRGDWVLYAGRDGTWTVRGTLPAVHPGSVVDDFLNSREGWVMDNGNGVEPSGKFMYVTRDGGQSWRKLSTNVNLENLLVAEIDFVNSKDGWMTGSRYDHKLGRDPRPFILKSIDGGITWENAQD